MDSKTPKIGDRVVSNHSSQRGVEGTVLRASVETHGCWWVRWDKSYAGGEREREYHQENFTIITPLSPFEQRVQAYIQRELNP